MAESGLQQVGDIPQIPQRALTFRVTCDFDNLALTAKSQTDQQLECGNVQQMGESAGKREGRSCSPLLASEHADHPCGGHGNLRLSTLPSVDRGPVNTNFVGEFGDAKPHAVPKSFHFLGVHPPRT